MPHQYFMEYLAGVISDDSHNQICPNEVNAESNTWNISTIYPFHSFFDTITFAGRGRIYFTSSRVHIEHAVFKVILFFAPLYGVNG